MCLITLNTILNYLSTIDFFFFSNSEIHLDSTLQFDSNSTLTLKLFHFKNKQIDPINV